MSNLTISKVVDQTVTQMFTDNPTLLAGQNKAIYTNALQAALVDIVGQDVQLSTTRPDYESVVLQLTKSLSADPAWKDIIQAATGQKIIGWIASGIAYGQFSIERALQEGILYSAKSPSGIRAITNMLGVRAQRKQSPYVTVTLTRTDTGTLLTIPAKSVFVIDSLPFFNRTSAVFQESQLSLQLQLHQGEQRTVEITSTGETFQKFEIGDGDSLVSNDDIEVYVAGTLWSRVTDAPWSLGVDSKSYFENTSNRGDMEITFGSGDFGRIPPSGATISINFIKTQGEAAHTTTSGRAVTWTTAPSGVTVTGETTTPVQGGGDEKSHTFYRTMAPHLRAANKRAVRRSDYRALATHYYPDIKDAIFRGQAELAPGRRSMMNVVGATLVTGTTWSSGDFEEWANEFKDSLAIYQTEFLNIPPTVHTMDVTATIYCRQDAQLESIKTRLTSIVGDFFAPKVGSLGFSIYRTDISDILNGRDANNPDELLEQQVSYVELDQSLDDLIIESDAYIQLGNLNLTMAYTSRSGYTGRLDLVPPSA